jgi:hypothetical protein
MIFSLSLASGGNNEKGRSFDLYLVKKSNQNASFSSVLLEDTPFIPMSEIISYSKLTHSIILKKEAFNRTKKIQLGTVFAVCIDNEPIYTGRVWSDLRSASSDGIVLICSRKDPTENRIFLQAGYPTEAFFLGQDLRASKLILNALDLAHKLKVD